MDSQNIQKLTPEALISGPTTSSGVPNYAGTHFLHTVSKYSFDTHTKSVETRVVDIRSGESILITSNAAERGHMWLGGIEPSDLIFWLEDAEDGSTEMWIRRLGSELKYQTGKIDGRIEAIKLKSLGQRTIAVVFAAKSTPAGELHNVGNAKTTQSSGRVYNSLPVRNWDHYVTPERNSIWYTTLHRDPGEDDIYYLNRNQPFNTLLGSGLQSPILREPWTDPAADFDLTASGGIVFVARNPKLPSHNVITSDLYYVAVPDFTKPPPNVPQIIDIPEFSGNCDGPVFSDCGYYVAALKVEHQKSYYGQYRPFVIKINTDGKGILIHSPEVVQVAKEWSLSPELVKWSKGTGSPMKLYMLAEDKGRKKLFKLDYDHSERMDVRRSPDALGFDQDSVLDFNSLGPDSDDNRLLVSRSSFVRSLSHSIISTLSGESQAVPKVTKQPMRSPTWNFGPKYDLSTAHISEFWYAGSREQQVHAWIIKPPNFDESKTYAVAFLLHGGPAGAWLNAWMSRWNPAVFAEHGYIVVMPNFAGSTGFGQDFIEAVSDYEGIPGIGTRPYQDVAACFECVKATMPFADTDRAVALGGSFGGYLINLIQGLPLGKEFKALVNHDGSFGYDQYAKDIFDFAHDMGGELWEGDNQRHYDWSRPIRLVNEHNWTTPMLIIHGELDYRCPITEGIAPFTVLQRKGIESQFLTFPDENHWVLKPENALLWWKTVLGWCDKFVGMEEGSNDNF